MKKLFLIAGGLLASVSLFAQGQLNFITAGTTTRIFESDGTTLLAGAAYKVDLYYGAVGANPSTFTSANISDTVFQSGALAGTFFRAGAITLPAPFAADTQADVQVRAWRVSDGATWQAAYNAAGHASPITAPVLTITLKGPPNTPLNLSGLANHSLIVVPEPSTILLGLAGIGGLLFLRRKMA
jgi:hypothetical protein